MAAKAVFLVKGSLQSLSSHNNNFYQAKSALLRPGEGEGWKINFAPVRVQQQCLLPSERRRQSMVNNMGAIQVWLDNSSVLAFWICFQFDNEHSDVWRVTCDVWRVTLIQKQYLIHLCWSTSTSTFLCPHDKLRKYFQQNKLNNKLRTKADQGWIWLHHYCQYK